MKNTDLINQIDQPKTEVVRLRVTPEFKDKIQAAAERENRTLSNYIINLIIKDLKGEEEMKDIKEKLTVRNLCFSHLNADGTMDLEFAADGKKVFARSVPIDDPTEEFYWDDEENIARAVKEAKEIEIQTRR